MTATGRQILQRPLGAACPPMPEAGLGLVALTAHELSGPLTALGISAELLHEDGDVLERAQIRTLAAGMRARVVWLQGLVENLLCAAAVREGRFRLRPEPLDLAALLAEMQVVVQPLLEQRGQRLRVPLPRPGRLPAVTADTRRVGQVLVNLILNASKFTPRAAAIDISVRRTRNGVRISIADRGPGLPPEGAAPLFAPFYRAAAGADAPGLGLGLSIARSIVEAHGGRMGAANRAGGGASFWFELPRTQAARAVRVAAGPPGGMTAVAPAAAAAPTGLPDLVAAD